MKRKITFLVAAVMLAVNVGYGQAPNSWTQKASFSGTARQNAVSFSIGNYGYIGTGDDGNGAVLKDFWQYDPVGDVWTQKADYGGGSRTLSSGFSLSGKGYIGIGKDSIGNLMNDFWCYDTTANMWTQKASVTGNIRYGAVSYTIAGYNYGFFALGKGATGYVNEFSYYNPGSDTWGGGSFNFPGGLREGASAIGFPGDSAIIGGGYNATTNTYYNDYWVWWQGNWWQAANFPGSKRQKAFGLSISGDMYIGGGTGSNGVNNDLWKYDKTFNIWSNTKAYLPTGISAGTAFSLLNTGYAGMGNTGSGLQNVFGEYAPAKPGQYTNTWSRLSDYAGDGETGGVGFSIGNKGYVGTGQNSGTGLTKSDFWEYDPANDSWTQKADVGGGGRSRAVGFCIGTKGYIGTGNASQGVFKSDFWEYDPTTNSWTQKADFGGGQRAEALGFGIRNKGYVGTGSTQTFSVTKDFWEYDPSTNAWTQKADCGVGKTSSYGGFGFAIGNRGYVGDLSYQYSNNFWAYNPISDTWIQKASFNLPSIYSNNGFRYCISMMINNKGYVGMGLTNSEFYEYDPAKDTWAERAHFIGWMGLGVGFSVAGKGYAGVGSFNGFIWGGYGNIPSNFKKSFWVYDPLPSTTIWTGAASTDWNTASNWNPTGVPNGNTNVLIPVTPNQPEIAANNTFAVVNITMDSGAILTIDTLSVLQTSDSLTLNGDITGAGLLSLNGTAGQIITANGTITNLELNNTYDAFILAGSTLNIKTKYYPTAGTLINNGTLTLLSDATGTATIGKGSPAGGYLTGTVNVQQYIHGGRRAYRFLAHPFSTATPIAQLATAFDITGSGGSANGFTSTGTNNPSAFWYNPVTANGSDTDDVTGWIPYTDLSNTGANTWNRFEGLRIMVRGAKGEGLAGQTYTPSATTINMHGTLSQGDLTTTLISNANKGYNFISNPYAAPIDLSVLTLGSSVGPNFYVWDPNQGLQGAYISQPLAVQYVLPAYSSFVLTATASANSTVTFHESGKGANDTAKLFKTTGGSMGSNMLQLHITSDNKTASWDRLLLYFNDNASADLDRLDATKWQNNDLNFYTYSADNKQQSIDVRPYVDGQVIQLGLNTTVQQTYSMDVDNLDIPAGVKISLHDKYLKLAQLLHQGDSYSFTVGTDPLSQGEGRFELNLSGTPTKVSNVTGTSKMVVTVSPNPAADFAMVSFSAPVKGNTDLQITTVTGQHVFSTDLGMQQTGNVTIPVAGMMPGVYIMTLHCGEETVTKRFVKQ